MRSYVAHSMQHHSLFLAGDAAHIFTPAGGKGMNLAIQDGHVMGEALVSYYRHQENLLLKNYSTVRFSEIWQTQEFSESLLHMINIQYGSTAVDLSMQRLQQFKLVQMANSEFYAKNFARQYVGYAPTEQPQFVSTVTRSTFALAS